MRHSFLADFFKSETTHSKSPRQAYFAHFSHQALQALESLPKTSTSPPTPLILLTGGLRTPAVLRTVLNSGHAHLLGIGRGSVLCPSLPSILKEKETDVSRYDDIPFGREPDLSLPRILDYRPFSWMWSLVPKIKLIGAGVGMAWYIVAIRHISHASTRSNSDIIPKYDMGGLGAVFWMWFWMPMRGMRSGRNWFDCFHIFSFFLIFIAILSSAYYYSLL